MTRTVRTFRGHPLRGVPWRALSVERASALGLDHGRFLEASTDAGERFMAVHGLVARGGGWNAALLDLTHRRAYAAPAEDGPAAEELAEQVVIDLLTCTCAQAAARRGLTEV